MIYRTTHTVLTGRFRQLRQILNVILFEDSGKSTFARTIHLILFLTVIVSQLNNILDTVYVGEDYKSYSNSIELYVFTVFFIEYAMRLFSFSVFGEYKYFWSWMNLIDLLSLDPLPILNILLIDQAYSLKVFLKLIRVLRIIKIKRYLNGVQILEESVANSIKQFYFLLLGFLILNMTFAVAFHYSEMADDHSVSMGDSLWFGIVTMCTVGYGDIVPVSVLGMFITGIVALIANSIIFALPVAILDRDFSGRLAALAEQKEIQKIKFQARRNSRRTTNRNKEYDFMNQRLQKIELRNKEIQDLLDKSNQMAKELTNDLKRLFQVTLHEEEDMIQSGGGTHMGEKNVLMVKANLYEKLARAKKKIQVTNIFRNIRYQNESDGEESNKEQKARSPFKRRSTKLKSYKKKKALIKSHSLDNQNELLRIRNEEFGQMPFEFLNEALLQIHHDMEEKVGNEHFEPNKPSTYFANYSDQGYQQSFGNFSMSSLIDKKQRKQTEISILDRDRDRRTIQLKPILINQLQKCPTENSEHKREAKIKKKELQEYRDKKKPKRPPEFFTESNYLRELEGQSFIAKDLQSTSQVKRTWFEFDMASPNKSLKMLNGSSYQYDVYN
ncbi:hypothetical protein pb186bvf_005998 [Paramecium bursaria]